MFAKYELPVSSTLLSRLAFVRRKASATMTDPPPPPSEKEFRRRPPPPLVKCTAAVRRAKMLARCVQQKIEPIRHLLNRLSKFARIEEEDCELILG